MFYDPSLSGCAIYPLECLGRLVFVSSNNEKEAADWQLADKTAEATKLRKEMEQLMVSWWSKFLREKKADSLHEDILFYIVSFLYKLQLFATNYHPKKNQCPQFVLVSYTLTLTLTYVLVWGSPFLGCLSLHYSFC